MIWKYFNLLNIAKCCNKIRKFLKLLISVTERQLILMIVIAGNKHVSKPHILTDFIKVLSAIKNILN